jgi:hypothetical protein
MPPADSLRPSPLGPDNENPLEGALNALNDSDLQWWPFLHLRPPSHRDLSNRHILKMSLHYGLAIFLLLVFAVGRHLTAALGAELLAVGIGSFFVIFRSTFAIAWNRRAKRIRSTR